MAYNTKAIKTDVNGNPISQYYNPETDEYEPVEGASGGNKVIIYNEDGTPNNSLNFGEILDKLDQLTGTVIAEQHRQQNEAIRQQNEQDRIDLYNALKDLDVSQYELRLQKLEHDTSVEEFILEEAYGSVISLPSNVVNGQISVTLKGNTYTNLVKNGLPVDTNGWRTYFTHSTLSIVNGFLRIAKNTHYVIGGRFDNLNIPVGRKIFVKFKGRANKAGTVSFRFNSSGFGLDNAGGIDFAFTTTETQFAAIITLTKTGNGFAFAGNEFNANGDYIEIKEVLAIDLTAYGLDSLTVDQCNQRFAHWFDGTKSTVCAMRLKSVNEGETEETIQYIIGKDQGTGEILELRSLPKGIKDEVRVSENKLIKRIGDKTNVASGTVINYADMAEGGTYYAWNDNGETETGTKGDTLGIDATVLIYQLAEPIEIPIEVFGNLQSYENGTVYVDAIIPRVDFYTSEGVYLENEPPIKEIDALYLVDKETGVLTSLDISKAFIFPDGKGFTHPDLYNDALVDWDYIPDVEGTNPTILMKLPTNLKASINSNINKIGDLSNKVDNLNIRMVAVRKNIQDLQNESNEHNEHKEEFNRYKQIYVPSNIVSRPMKYIAHRGASAIAPENTIPAYELAGQLGFWGVEADAIVTKDGVWVAFHDTNVERMTNGSGNIQEMTFAEVQSLKIDAGANVNYYPDQKIPTIEEFLNICIKWELVPIIEVKGNMGIENAQSLIELIQSKGLIGKVIISSLQLSHLTTIREINKEVFVEYATFFDSSTIDIIKSLGNAMLSLGYRRVNESVARQCAQNNIILSSFTINDYNIAKSFEQLGISQIYTDILC